MNAKAAVPSPMTREERYENALKWIRLISGMHYFGGAFEPEHMRGLANIAANALLGTDLPDFDESSAKAEKRARRMAEELQGLFADPDDPDDDEEDDGE
jgi:hypothetical protein